MKKTRTRESIIKLLKNSNSPMSANDIYEILKPNKITLSSIYRTLDIFYKENIIIKDLTNRGTAIYTLHKDTHNHYLECRSCHKKIKLEYCPYHKINSTIKKEFNFIVDEKNLVIYGLCDECIKKAEI